MCPEYEMLSTGLFTEAPVYSQCTHREKANKAAGFARFQQSSVSVNSPAPEALVDKFFHDGGKKPPSGINFDLTMPPEGQAAGAAGVDEDPAGFFLAVSFLRLM